MATLEDYKGLEVVSPDPTGAGGIAIQNNFKKLVDWQVVGVLSSENAPPGTSEDRFLGERYLVGGAPTDPKWTNKENQVATWDGSDWQFTAPQSVFNAADSRIYLANDQASPIQADAEGNARGTAAVDLQGKRGADTEVASGDYSTVSGGRGSGASGDYSTVVGGYQAVAGQYGQVAHAAGGFAAAGDAQASTLVARAHTTNSSLNAMYLDGAGASESMDVPANTAWAYDIHVVGLMTDATGPPLVQGLIARNVWNTSSTKFKAARNH